MVTVETGARLHFGFQNLSLAHPRLYGGVGVGLQEPALSVTVEPETEVRCTNPDIEPYLRRAVDALDVEGAVLTVEKAVPRHAGLGSGTQLALACLLGVARAYGHTVDPRAYASELGRGGRSGVGVATFETGGFVVDAGHPTSQFTSAPPEPGEWVVPKPIVTRPLPDDWRFVLITPETEAPGLSGEDEDRQIRTVIERADPTIADEISTLLTRELLPAVAEANVQRFGRAVARLGQLNGAWYADEQGGVYRPPAGTLIESLTTCAAITGAGQSSWGPTVYGVTTAEDAEVARTAAADALAAVELCGTIRVVRPSNQGTTVQD